MDQNTNQYQSTEQVLERIRKEQTNFSVAQAKVASYILDNYFSIPFLSITSLAANIGVSETTVIKFCNHLGYKKFANFKHDLANCAKNELVMSNRLTDAPPENSDTIIQKEIDDDVAAIEATLSDAQNIDSIKRLIPMIDECDRLYIAGGRSSGIIAELFVNMLRYLGIKVHFLDIASPNALDCISIVSPKDLVIVLAFPRYTQNVIKSMEIMHRSNIPLALITDTGLSPGSPYATLIFRCKVTSSYYFPCTVGCIALINAISRAVSSVRKDKAARHIANLEQELLEENVFYK